MEHLYPGETLDIIAGYPTIYHYQPACDQYGGISKPLIVCVTGALHLARIFYGGHKGSKPSDFIAYWLSQHGHAVLSLSYPLETKPPIMPPTSASFRLSDWGRQAATTTRKAINEKNLPNNSVILISWSMGGRMVVPFTIAAKELALDVIQYISFAATPGFSSIRPPQPGLAPANSGYFTVQARLENFCTQLLEMQKLNGNGDTEREIIPRDVYMREYVGATPINIIGLGLRYDDEKKGFVPDDVPHEHDSQVLNISNFPFITALYPTSILDASHALADRATWGFLLTYKLENMIGKHGLRNVQGKEDGDGTWKRLSDLVRSAPERLCLPVPGNHFFFVGEKSARDVAASVERVIGEAGDFQRELASLIESSA